MVIEINTENGDLLCAIKTSVIATYKMALSCLKPSASIVFQNFWLKNCQKYLSAAPYSLLTTNTPHAVIRQDSVQVEQLNNFSSFRSHSFSVKHHKIITVNYVDYSTHATPPPPPESNDQEESIDDLRSILKDRSLGLTQKFKIVFQQYGVVAVCVHLVNTAFWVSIIYTALSQ